VQAVENPLSSVYCRFWSTAENVGEINLKIGQ